MNHSVRDRERNHFVDLFRVQWVFFEDICWYFLKVAIVNCQDIGWYLSSPMFFWWKGTLIRSWGHASKNAGGQSCSFLRTVHYGKFWVDWTKSRMLGMPPQAYSRDSYEWQTSGTIDEPVLHRGKCRTLFLFQQHCGVFSIWNLNIV